MQDDVPDMVAEMEARPRGYINASPHDETDRLRGSLPRNISEVPIHMEDEEGAPIEARDTAMRPA